MNELSQPGRRPRQPIGRILEIGEHCLIGRGRPGATDYVCTSLDGPPPDLPSHLNQLEPIAALRALRAGAYGLIVAHAPAFAAMRASVLRFTVRKPFERGLPLILRANLARLIPADVPVVMLDLEDAPIVYANNLPLLDRALLYFKRELPADRARAFLQTKAPVLPDSRTRVAEPLATRIAKLRPISSGLSDAVLAAAPEDPIRKASDVFFAGKIAGSSTLRQCGAAELIGLTSRGVNVDFATGRLPLADFLKRAAAARLVWSPEGYAHECFRHYEAAAVWSVPVINTPGIERLKPLLHGVHAIYYGVEPGGLTRAIVNALREPERLLIMGRAARRHALRYHSHAALAQYVMGETEAKLDGR